MNDLLKDFVDSLYELTLSERVASIEETARGLVPLVTALEEQLADIQAKLAKLQPDSLLETIASRLQPSEEFLASIDRRIAQAVDKVGPGKGQKKSRHQTYWFSDKVMTPNVKVEYLFRKRSEASGGGIPGPQIVYDIIVDNPGITGDQVLAKGGAELLRQGRAKDAIYARKLAVDAVLTLVGHGKVTVGENAKP
jgi:hypothetical protein